MFDSLRARILFWGTAVLLVFLGLFAFSLSWVERELTRETEQRAGQNLETVRWLLNEQTGFASSEALESWVTRLGQRSGVRITYIVAGKVIADSDMSYEGLAGMEDHSKRPEVLEALDDGEGMRIRYSATLRKDMLYMARRMDQMRSVPDGVLRVAIPLSEVRSRFALVRSGLLWAFGSALGVVLLLSWLLSRSLTRTVCSFAGRAADIGAGRYENRLWVPPGGEFRPLAEAVNSMAAGIQRQIATVEAQREQLKAMFEGLAEGVMVLDGSGRLASFNKALAEFWTLPLTAQGKTVLELTRSVELQDLADRVLRDGSHGEMSLDLPGGRHLRVSVVPFADDGGRKVVLVCHDVTALRRSERALRDFVTNVSHQLRTPLTSIRGYAETLRDAPPPDPKLSVGFLETIIRNARHMDGVLSGMLALARSEQTGLRLELHPVDAVAVAGQALDDLTPEAGSRGLHLSADFPEEPLAVLGEPQGLLEIFHNLLGNALRHSPKGGTVRVSGRREGDRVVLAVHDQGPGIPADLGEKVFERFFKVDPNAVDKDGGAGLGLAICRQIARNFGGDVTLAEPGSEAEGAEFLVTLRAAPGTAA